MHEEYLQLAKTYGDFVRIAPNEVMTTDVDALVKVHGGASKCTKGMVYDNLHLSGIRNLDGIEDRASYKLRRQVWNKAFNTRCVESDWLTRVEELAAAGQAVDDSLFSLLISFDNMGRVGFSREFGLVTAGKESHYLELIEWLFGSIAVLGSSFGWPVPIRTDNPEDVMKYFIADRGSEDLKSFESIETLYSDSAALFIGATDTIDFALSTTFYYLAKYPDLRPRLRDGLKKIVTESGGFQHSDLPGVELMDAIINETMRMHSPIGANGSRFNPPEGMAIGDTLIPGDVGIYLPTPNCHHCEMYFKHAVEFIDRETASVAD
ncbi:Tryprostatin B 6-hydroxylase [Cytospora mali]|uniref:Tryprostatin B 6-hydroxylase n=1 Tax=Cytospora mali TaxID=578113 RepID=A0A194VTX5_CYTMA|nr:Tryprostatin B 6-hydroxylase [Valsa mali]